MPSALPPDVLVRCTSFLSAEVDIVRAGLVCKAWLAAVADTAREVFLGYFEPSVLGILPAPDAAGLPAFLALHWALGAPPAGPFGSAPTAADQDYEVGPSEVLQAMIRVGRARAATVGSSDREWEEVTLDAHKEAVEALYYDPGVMLPGDGQPGLLVTASRDSGVSIWRGSPGAMELHVETKPRYQPLWCLDVLPEQDLLVSGGADSKCFLSSLSSGEDLWCFDGHGDSVFVTQFIPQRELLLTGSWDGSVCVHQISDRKGGEKPVSSTGLHGDAVWR
eukprot:Hpha_TRINITY_DN33704_c0_g1::TRINITY_DN33704_c0_g1_i1::g.25039::m.25039